MANLAGLDLPPWGCLGLGCVLSPSCRVTWTDPPNVGFSFPGCRLPLLPFFGAPSPPSSRHPEGSWVSQPRASLSPGLQTSIQLGLQVSHVSTLSPLPWQSPLPWAFLSPFPSSEEQRHLWDSAERGPKGVTQGWGHSERCSRKLHAAPSAGTLTAEASVATRAWAPVGVLGPGVPVLLGVFFFKYVLDTD